jgi:ComF family protein
LKLSSITQWLKQLRLPQHCILCTEAHAGSDAVCDHCLSLFIPTSFCCSCCALPLPPGNFLLCGQCIQKKPDFDRVTAPYPFEEPLRSVLHEFKYHQGLYLISFLAKLIRMHLPMEALRTDCLIPVPMHPQKLQQRGFNQAVELTKLLARQLKLPYDLHICKKILHTTPQAELNAEKRRSNLLHAFITGPIPYHHVTLIDDLLTTGSTANALAKSLKKQGVQKVNVWCCARAHVFEGAPS